MGRDNGCGVDAIRHYDRSGVCDSGINWPCAGSNTRVVSSGDIAMHRAREAEQDPRLECPLYRQFSPLQA